MPMAVRCAPGMGCAFNPRDSTLSHTARTCSGVACACITISMGWAPENVSLTDLLTRQALRGNPFKTGVPRALGARGRARRRCGAAPRVEYHGQHGPRNARDVVHLWTGAAHLWARAVAEDRQAARQGAGRFQARLE